ncbi:Mu homology domain-containing protein [Rhodotorula diobovata]|uniref:Mu homology domain-containing protein n=1 Tax=Rhodotorula diobovata TaxID=5288 RepID=A0A5C5FT76_9BASI|nr:Mu homology domain-containing protein [Rhodotorula diobovata]
MQGIVITDLQGRRILSTHFASSLAPTLAIDAALNASSPVTWVPAPTTTTDDDTDDDDDDDAAHSGRRRGGGGFAVCHTRRNQLRYIAPLDSDIDPLVPLTFLSELHDVLDAYIPGPVTQGSLKDNFDVVLALLHEMVAAGGRRPQLSQASQLKDLVVPPDSQLLKVALNAATAAGITMIPPQTTANALIASPLPWRRQGIKYASNEIYFDLSETLHATLSPTGKPLSASVAGTLTCRSRLSGMPDLALHLTDPSVLDEGAAFHSCVRYARWNKDRVVSFVPPDGTFPLLSYLHTPPTPTASSSLSPALLLALLPLALTATQTSGPAGIALALCLTPRTPDAAAPLRNIEVRVPLARGAGALSAVLGGGGGGGAARREEGGAGGGGSGGAGSWEVVSELVDDGGAGGGGAERERQTLVWRLDSLGAMDRPATLSAQYLAPPSARPPPSLTATFDTPSSSFTGLRISALRVLGEPYGVYKGVKSQGRGVVEVRTG